MNVDMAGGSDAEVEGKRSLNPVIGNETLIWKMAATASKGKDTASSDLTRYPLQRLGQAGSGALAGFFWMGVLGMDGWEEELRDNVMRLFSAGEDVILIWLLLVV